MMWYLAQMRNETNEFYLCGNTLRNISRHHTLHYGYDTLQYWTMYQLSSGQDKKWFEFEHVKIAPRHTLWNFVINEKLEV